MMKRLAVIATVLAISLGLTGCANTGEIGRASCRERVFGLV